MGISLHASTRAESLNALRKRNLLWIPGEGKCFMSTIQSKVDGLIIEQSSRFEPDTICRYLDAE